MPFENVLEILSILRFTAPVGTAMIATRAAIKIRSTLITNIWVMVTSYRTDRVCGVGSLTWVKCDGDEEEKKFGVGQ